MIMDNGMVKRYNNGTTLYHFQKVSNPQSIATAGVGGKDLNLRPSGYEFYVQHYYWIILGCTN